MINDRVVCGYDVKIEKKQREDNAVTLVTCSGFHSSPSNVIIQCWPGKLRNSSREQCSKWDGMGRYAREEVHEERKERGIRGKGKIQYQHFLFPLRALRQSQPAHRNTATVVSRVGQANPCGAGGHLAGVGGGVVAAKLERDGGARWGRRRGGRECRGSRRGVGGVSVMTHAARDAERRDEDVQ